MDSRWVKAAGGCSAPGGKYRVPASLLGKMKFRFEDEIKYNEPTLVQLMIRHPNESALAADFDPSKVPQFVRSVLVTYAGKPVMSAEVDFSLSDNPTFRFWFVPHGEGRAAGGGRGHPRPPLYPERARSPKAVPLPGRLRAAWLRVPALTGRG